MQNKMKALQHRLEVLKAEKKGAASIETIIIAGLLIAVTVAIGGMLIKTMNTNAQESAGQINADAESATSLMKDDYGSLPDGVQ